MSGISGHMIVKNEDKWVWYAISSILPYVDELLITDTGSTDHTLDLIRSFRSKKISLTQITASTPAQVTSAREAQLSNSRYPWIWIIDADEIYPSKTAKECLALTQSSRYEGILVRRYDLLGDIYHRQSESVGTYNLFGHSGHLLIRLVNRAHLPGLHYQGDYPNEGFFDAHNHSILTHDPNRWALTKHSLYHAMYLRRSSIGSNLPMFNRSKYKIDLGIAIKDTPPEVLKLSDPLSIGHPLSPRSWSYNLAARVITPIKQLKRKYL